MSKVALICATSPFVKVSRHSLGHMYLLRGNSLLGYEFILLISLLRLYYSFNFLNSSKLGSYCVKIYRIFRFFLVSCTSSLGRLQLVHNTSFSLIN
jgi:hypothetical protein